MATTSTIEFIRQILTRPHSIVDDGSFSGVVAYLEGYDRGTNSLNLTGFKTWMATKWEATQSMSICSVIRHSLSSFEDNELTDERLLSRLGELLFEYYSIELKGSDSNESVLDKKQLDEGSD